MNTPTKTPAPIFLYLKSCRMSKLVIQQLIAAGYIPIEVASFDDVKIFEPLPLLQHQTISAAAIETILHASEYSSIADDFGKRVAKALVKGAESD